MRLAIFAVCIISMVIIFGLHDTRWWPPELKCGDGIVYRNTGGVWVEWRERWMTSRLMCLDLPGVAGKSVCHQGVAFDRLGAIYVARDAYLVGGYERCLNVPSLSQ